MKTFRFKAQSDAQRVEVSNGHVSRTFERDQEPFELTPQDVRLVLGVEDLEEVPADSPATQTTTATPLLLTTHVEEHANDDDQD